MAGTPSDVLKQMKDSGIEVVDVRFCDLPGLMQHFSVPAHELSEDVFEDGLGFDGSSIRGFQEIQESDMLLIPDPTTAVIDPFREHPTLNINCFVRDPVTGESYSRDPRYIAQKAESYLVSTGIADTAYFGPEAEFYIFDSVRFDQNQHSGYYFLDSVEGVWNSGRERELSGAPNLAYKPRYKEGYFPVPPMDQFQDLRSEMVRVLEQVGITIEVQHHEVGTAGQAEIDMRFDTLAVMADKLMLYKYVVKNVARAAGYSVTFMPKPIFMDNGSGMHVHQSLWKGGEPTFFDEKGYAGLSDNARWYIGGLLKHAPAICAFSNPTTNSYKRLVPGYEAPVNLVYSQRNRSASVRIPLYSKSPKAKRLEFRCPDPSCNPYLAFSAMLMAGLDGIQNRVEPPAPVDRDLYDLPPEELAKVPHVPGSLNEALDALKADHEFMLKGDVFTPDVIETWIDYKQEHEIDQVQLRPHPWEFYLYYDIEVLWQATGEVLPAAVAVALSPIPIVAIVLVLGSPHARTAGPTFALGWVAGLAVVSVVVVLVAGNASDPDSDTATGVNWMLAAIGVLFLVMAARQWRKRPRHGEQPEMPKWMASIDAVSPAKALGLGVALSAANPKNLALTLAASASIAQSGLDGTDEVAAIIAFVVIGSLTVAGAVVFSLVAPRASERPLASVRQFMADNNATIMMVILLILGVKVLGDAVGGLFD